MADNKTVTTGVLETSTWATDEDSGTNYQGVKVMLGANGTFTGYLPGDATQGAFVQPRRKVVRLSDASSGTTTASTNYTAGDQVGAIQSIANAVRSTVLSGTVTGAIIVNAVTLGLETAPSVMAEIGGLLGALDDAILGVFVVELALKLYANGLRFFRPD